MLARQSFGYLLATTLNQITIVISKVSFSPFMQGAVIRKMSDPALEQPAGTSGPPLPVKRPLKKAPLGSADPRTPAQMTFFQWAPDGVIRGLHGFLMNPPATLLLFRVNPRGDRSIYQFLHTAGFPKHKNSGFRCGSGCRCPISIPRPDSETSQKTASGSYD